MQRDGLISMPGRGRGRQGEGIELTTEGRAQAEVLLRQHRLAERFLVDTLGMDWVQAHEEAHNIERGMSPAVEERLMTLLGNPRTCPHGNPIPSSTMNTVEYLREQNALRLIAAPVGVTMKVLLISEVVEDELALLRGLGQMDIMPGATITVLESDETARTLTVRIIPRDKPDATRTETITSELGAKIWVREPAG